MNVSMTTLAVGVLTAFCYGIGLWVVFSALIFLSRLAWGEAKRAGKSKGAKVRREIFYALFCIFCASALVVFLYLVNRGIFRWFLVASVFLGFYLLYRFVSPRLDAPMTRVAKGVRWFVIHLILWVTYPFRLVFGFLGSLVGKLLRKCYLRIAVICDKINTRNYDRWQRKRLKKTVYGEVTHLCQIRNV